MAIIYTYPTVVPEASDILLGTEVGATLRNPTKNFKIGDIADFIIDTLNGTSLKLPLFFDVTDPVTGVVRTTLVDSIISQNANPGGNLILISGNLKVENAIQDSTGSPGTAGQVLSSTVTGTQWVAAPGATFTFTQAVPSNTWVIVHSLNKFPSVTAVSTANQVAIGDVVYNSTNQLTITFSAGFAGKAYLN